MSEINMIHLKPAKFAVDLGDGSERGFYVNQDYILQKMGRPHRAINLMYCYYPFEKTWPQRASDVFADSEISFAWDYPYDDYFPYTGGMQGDTKGEPFTCMRDIRRHGQDIILTLTCDPKVTDQQIIAIAKDLSTFGRIMLRLNHEATGEWFSFNKRASYQEVADFFVRFHKIIKKEAPNVRTIICIDGVKSEKDIEIEKEKEFTEAVKAADIWSVDKYMALNWGWPYEVAEKENHQHKLDSPEYIYQLTKNSYKRFRYLNGGESKPMLMSEMNADGDVTGPFKQLEMVQEFCKLIKEDPERWFSGFTFYQFRDDGRLGLEITDTNNSEVGIEQPVLSAYRDIIQDPFFSPEIEMQEKKELPIQLRWGGSEDSQGMSIKLDLEGMPVFAEGYFDGELQHANLMIELHGRWFYKAPGVKFIDFMPAFFNHSIQGKTIISMNIFAPPATGENDATQGPDWQENYYYTIKELPRIRLRYEAII